MGIQKLGLTLADQCAKYAKASGKSNILFTKDMAKGMSIEGLKLAPSLDYDMVTFSKTSLFSETFVKSLTKIRGKNKTETIKKIKDEILSKMGYKNPSALEVKPLGFMLQKDLITAGFDPRKCTLIIGKEISNFKIEEAISVLYHELDHMDKFVKLYKALGAERFKACLKKTMESNLPNKEWGKLLDFDKSININTKAYEALSKDISLEGFDVKKWSKAAQEYISGGSKYCDLKKYFDNAFEVSAYNIESEIKRLLGQPTVTAKDYFPSNYSKMINLLKRQGITDINKQESIIEMAINCSEAGELNKKALKAIQKAVNGSELTSTEEEIIEKAYKDLNSRLMSDYKFNPDHLLKSKQKKYEKAESYISRGLLTRREMIDDLIKGLNHKTA